MDSKKVIEKLVKIAEKQQKIIQKLAQAQPLPQSLPVQPGGVAMYGGETAAVKKQMKDGGMGIVSVRVLPDGGFEIEIAKSNATQAYADAAKAALDAAVKAGDIKHVGGYGVKFKVSSVG